MLNFHIEGTGNPYLLLHGLFGNLDNLKVIGNALKENHQVIRVDLRNHGLSPWSNEMNYLLMAQDLVSLCQHLHLEDITVIGHSMGGKTAMMLASLLDKQIKKMIILDMAPINYTLGDHGYDAIFLALDTVSQQKITTRTDAAAVMRTFISDENTLQFLLKSFRQGQWVFNANALKNNIQFILGWQPLAPWKKPILFIKGQKSDYIQSKDRTMILSQFPLAKIHIIANAGHNVHAEKPERVIYAINKFITC